MDSVNEDDLCLSVITVGEIQRGIEKLSESHRKTSLVTWLNDQMLLRFENKILPVDLSAMQIWGTLTARMESAGKPMGVMDSLIAASALSQNLILVTRNIKDFSGTNLQLINPWD
jgi:predicted nucleic acid-binding protein